MTFTYQSILNSNIVIKITANSDYKAEDLLKTFCKYPKDFELIETE